MKFGKVFPRFFLAVVPLLFSGCVDNFFPSSPPVVGSGKMVSETRPVATVLEVNLSGVGKLDMAQGAADSLVVEADDNVLPYIETRMDGARLSLGLRSNTNLQNATIRYHLVVRDLHAFNISGSGEGEMNALKTEHLDLRVSGAGNMKFGTLDSTRLRVDISGSGAVTLDQATADSLKADISGAGKIVVAGSARSQEATISGSGLYSAKALASKEAMVVVSGAGNARVACSDTLNASVMGSGEIRYSGRPKVVSSVSGAGTIGAE